MAQPINPASYKIEIRDQFGRPVVILARPQQLQYSLYRNKPGSIQFILDLYDPQALPQFLQNSIYDIVVRRNTVPVCAGQITYHEPKVDDSDSQKEVDITATGYFDQFDYRIVTNDYPGFDAIHNTLPFPPTDVGQIAWSLIEYSQFPVPDADDTTQSTVELNGSFAIQQSFIASGTANLKKLKFVIQNGSLYTGTVTSAFGANGTYSGKATSANSSSLTDVNQPWGSVNLNGGVITINTGTDAGDTKTISSTSGGTINISGSWSTTPDTTSTYTVTPVSSSTSTLPSTLTDNTANWTPNAFAGGTVNITVGTDLGDSQIIQSNTSNTITLYGNANTWTGTLTGAGTTQIISTFSGTANSATATTLIDPNIPWGTANLTAGSITITGGTGSGQTRAISFASGDTITVTSPWTTIPNGTSTYTASTALANGTTVGTMTDTNQIGWASSYILGGTVTFNAGTDAGDSQTIIAVSGDTVTVGANWEALPDTTTTYTITSSIGNGINTGTPPTPGSQLIDTNQDWIVNALVGQSISITTGTDNGDAATITANTSNTISIEGEWQINLDTTSTYQIIPGLSGQWSITPDTTSTYSITPLIPTTVGNFYVELINDLNNAPRGTVVPNSQATVPMSTIPNALGWYEIDYSTTVNPVSLVEGTRYWLQLSVDTQPVDNGLVVQVLGTTYYPYGNATSLQQPTLFTSDQSIQFFVLLSDNSYQMTKNTYMNIQLGTIQPSFRLSPNVDQYKHLKEAIEDLSTTYNGIDFAITVSIDPVTNYMTKYFNVYYPGIGIDNTSLNFSYPGNIKKIEKPKDGTVMYNEVWMRGQGSGTAQIVSTQRNNASIFTYGLRQVDESQSDVSDLPTLTSLAQEFLAINAYPSDLPAIYMDGNLPPSLGNYGIGDWITINVNDPRALILSFYGSYRIETLQITWDQDSVEEIQINCDNVTGYNLLTSGGS